MKEQKFSEIHRKNLEAAMRLAQLSVENSQKIMALQNELAREILQESADSAKAQAEAADPQAMLTLRSRYAQETTQKMIAAAQKIAAVGNEARAEFSRLLTEQLAAGSQEMVDAFQSFFTTLPGQNTNVMENMQQAVATANRAFEQMAEASAAVFGQMKEFAPGAAKKK
ncbi:MAG TPA: phasin family protein [Rhodocyclaceae bacterium]|nr:phasin family protein [Rhodocyclaceae bacterium]